MKGWRELTKLSDLAPTYEIEVECRRCHKSYMRWPAELMANEPYQQMFMDELQAALKCRSKHCPGPVKVAVLYDHLITSFIGGMP